MHFDPSARFECSRPLTARVSPKDAANDCPLYEARTSLERETTTAVGPASASTGPRRREAPRRALGRPSTNLFKSRSNCTEAYNRRWAYSPRRTRSRSASTSSAIDTPVTLLLFTQTIGGSESGPVAKQVLDELATLNDKISVVEKNFVLDSEDRATYRVEREPAIVVLGNGEDTRMRFLGAPTGYEFVPLVEAVLLAGTGKVELEPESETRLASVTEPTDIKVFSTPT